MAAEGTGYTVDGFRMLDEAKKFAITADNVQSLLVRVQNLGLAPEAFGKFGRSVSTRHGDVHELTARALAGSSENLYGVHGLVVSSGRAYIDANDAVKSAYDTVGGNKELRA